MTYTSPELPITAERVERIDLPVASCRIKPDGEFRKLREDSTAIFDLQFSHSRKLLQFIARRILNCVDEAEQAVKNCRLTASRNPPAFSSEGAFKSWLVRILIDEATLLLRRKSNPAIAVETKSDAQAASPTSQGRAGFWPPGIPGKIF